MCQGKKLKETNQLEKGCYPIITDYKLMNESCHKIGYKKLDSYNPKGQGENTFMDIYTPDVIEQCREGFDNLKLLKFNLSRYKNQIQDRVEESMEIKN